MGAHKDGRKGKKSSPGKPNMKNPMPYPISEPVRTPGWNGQRKDEATAMWYSWLGRMKRGSR